MGAGLKPGLRAVSGIGRGFGINAMPHTREVTIWGDVSVGDRVNLEGDTMARYVARLQEVVAG
ncbi:hypothetical protein [Roseovarius indicus]|uniref:Lumazine-binding domain-containing protein n=1 Tax=Roseovarius indicus TaxID=540747 RepID=A0A0T5P836_9RHOB|nr:hypothetical protein [Roseovarius indicus]KRS17290.1 hypothetical protein XM52_14640 [Roseovarius indicus]